MLRAQCAIHRRFPGIVSTVSLIASRYQLICFKVRGVGHREDNQERDAVHTPYVLEHDVEFFAVLCIKKHLQPHSSSGEPPPKEHTCKPLRQKTDYCSRVLDTDGQSVGSNRRRSGGLMRLRRVCACRLRVTRKGVKRLERC